MEKISTLSLLVAVCLLPASCGRTAVSWTTTADRSLLFAEAKVKVLKESPSASLASRGDGLASAPVVLEMDESETFQNVEGFGPAITGATCYNLLKMTPKDRRAFLRELFDPRKGLGISLVRCSIGASDFSVDEDFTWCDTPGLENFAPHREDLQMLFPILKEIYAINPGLQIIGSPWSVPRWMKRRSVDDDSDFYSWRGGSLKPSCYADYAEYFVRWIRTMEGESFRIHAITPQNEPLHPGNSMSTYMTWQEQAEFIKTALGPAFRKAGLKTKILVFDHNYNYDRKPDQAGYPLHIYEDVEASQYVAGSAWHNYGGTPAELDNILAAAPDKEIYFTEASIGKWNYSFERCLVEDFDKIFLQTLSRGNKGVTLWNLLLDEEGKPFRPGGCSICYGAVSLASGEGRIAERNSQYYDIAHASKVVRPGAVRVALRGELPEGMNALAFRNPEGTLAILAVNKGDAEAGFVLKFVGGAIDCTLPARSVVSWRIKR